jgi:hypothetical protein
MCGTVFLLDFVHNLLSIKTITFQKWVLFPSSGDWVRRNPYFVGPLNRVIFNSRQQQYSKTKYIWCQQVTYLVCKYCCHSGLSSSFKETNRIGYLFFTGHVKMETEVISEILWCQYVRRWWTSKRKIVIRNAKWSNRLSVCKIYRHIREVTLKLEQGHVSWTS